MFFFFFSSRRRHTRFDCDWSSDVCSSDLARPRPAKKRACRPAPLATSSTGPRVTSCAQRTTHSDGASAPCKSASSAAPGESCQADCANEQPQRGERVYRGDLLVPRLVIVPADEGSKREHAVELRAEEQQRADADRPGAGARCRV